MSEALDYEQYLKKRAESKTSATLTTSDYQRIIDAGAIQPSIWDNFPVVRELRKQLGDQELEISQLREAPWYNENRIDQYRAAIGAMQKSGVGADVMATNIANHAALHARGMDGASLLLHRKKPMSIYMKAALLLLGILAVSAGYNVATHGDLTLLWTTTFYGVPTPMLIFLMFALGVYVIWRHDKNQKQNPP